MLGHHGVSEEPVSSIRAAAVAAVGVLFLAAAYTDIPPPEDTPDCEYSAYPEALQSTPALPEIPVTTYVVEEPDGAEWPEPLDVFERGVVDDPPPPPPYQPEVVTADPIEDEPPPEVYVSWLLTLAAGVPTNPDPPPILVYESEPLDWYEAPEPYTCFLLTLSQPEAGPADHVAALLDFSEPPEPDALVDADYAFYIDPTIPNLTQIPDVVVTDEDELDTIAESEWLNAAPTPEAPNFGLAMEFDGDEWTDEPTPDSYAVDGQEQIAKSAVGNDFAFSYAVAGTREAVGNTFTFGYSVAGAASLALAFRYQIGVARTIGGGGKRSTDTGHWTNQRIHDWWDEQEQKRREREAAEAEAAAKAALPPPAPPPPPPVPMAVQMANTLGTAPQPAVPEDLALAIMLADLADETE